ncbi:glycosyltransferase [Actinoplanes sp. NPDC051851]|uniref:glycosyltransferase n=1 Tax=Actinoplanes sp. NPDC051851 TaxID=3154753 RepID=UPI00343EDADC
MTSAQIPRLPADDAFARAVTDADLSESVSAVLATYNRCPYDPRAGRLEDNPLSWALDTLRGQRGGTLREIVVVDDGSTDHTPAVLQHYRALPGIPVRPLRLAEHAGAAAARNAATAVATGRWLLFGDDDCIIAPYTAAAAAHTLATLQNRNPQAAALMMPFYYRALRPHELRPLDGIGKLDPASATFTTHFHTWPAEYGSTPPRLAGQHDVVAPFEVQLIAGTALIDAAALHRAGGFADLSHWSSSYSDHLHLSADLSDTGARLYHCPDPRLGAAHLKWGAVGRYRLHDDDLAATVPILGRRFADLVALAAQPRTDTGCRIAEDAFHPEMIGSFFAFFAGRSLRGGLAWARRCWTDFVENGQIYSSAIAETPPYPARVTAWRAGLARGAHQVIHTLRPNRSAADMTALLADICAQVGQPLIQDLPQNAAVTAGRLAVHQPSSASEERNR